MMEIEQIIQIIQSRIESIRVELTLQYMGNDFYTGLEARVSELECLLDEIQMKQ